MLHINLSLGGFHLSLSLLHEGASVEGASEEGLYEGASVEGPSEEGPPMKGWGLEQGKAWCMDNMGISTDYIIEHGDDDEAEW